MVLGLACFLSIAMNCNHKRCLISGLVSAGFVSRVLIQRERGE
jgi:hypothetical protein